MQVVKMSIMPILRFFLFSTQGGLLMGNMYTMRPDLFGAIHCAVPLLDMKRYHTLLAGASWMAEYGDPDTDDWKFLETYSPYHSTLELECAFFDDARYVLSNIGLYVLSRKTLILALITHLFS